MNIIDCGEALIYTARMQNEIKNQLQRIPLAYLGTDLLTAKALTGLTIDGDKVYLQITLGFMLPPIEQNKWTEQFIQLLQPYFPQFQFNVMLNSAVQQKVLFSQIPPHPEIKNIIAVGSGKGGVGKSTTSVNLACALASDGAKVGILDADIYGPNQPHMLGVNQKPTVYDNKRFDPVISYGMQSMSIGYLVDPNTAMIWRGPMVSGALQQLFFDTNWSDLDYLIIDLPPGTGDIQLTLSKKIPVTAALVVTTPQDVALLDARKAVEMFKKVSVPVFGLIENMAIHTCSQCGHQEHIFGADGVRILSADVGVPLLGSLPLDINIRQQADLGNPIVRAHPKSTSSQAYIDIARSLAARLSLQASVPFVS